MVMGKRFRIQQVYLVFLGSDFDKSSTYDFPELFWLSNEDEFKLCD